MTTDDIRVALRTIADEIERGNNRSARDKAVALANSLPPATLIGGRYEISYQWCLDGKPIPGADGSCSPPLDHNMAKRVTLLTTIRWRV